MSASLSLRILHCHVNPGIEAGAINIKPMINVWHVLITFVMYLQGHLGMSSALSVRMQWNRVIVSTVLQNQELIHYLSVA